MAKLGWRLVRPAVPDDDEVLAHRPGQPPDQRDRLQAPIWSASMPPREAIQDFGLSAGLPARHILLAAMRLRYSVVAAAVMGCLIPLPMLLGATVGWWLINSEQISRGI